MATITVDSSSAYIEPPCRRTHLYGEQSEQIHLLAAAMAQAQSVLKPAVKRHKSHFGAFANLEDVWEAAQAAFPQFGLSVTQPTMLLGTRRVLVTQVTHSSGQWLRSVEPLFNDSPDAQKRKSEVTVVRRMALCALLGIVDEDDEGAQQRDADPDSATSLRTLRVARMKLAACKTDDEKVAVLKRAKELLDEGQLAADAFALFKAECGVELPEPKPEPKRKEAASAK